MDGGANPLLDRQMVGLPGYLSLYPFVLLIIHLSIYLPICLFIYPSVCLSVFLTLCPIIYLSIYHYLSMYLFARPICLSVGLSTDVAFSVSIGLFICKNPCIYAFTYLFAAHF